METLPDRANRALTARQLDLNHFIRLRGMAAFELDVLGPTRARRNGVTTPIRAGRLRQLLAALLVDGPRTVRSEVLLERLWSEGEADASAATLHVTVNRLRRMLEPERSSPDPWTTIVRDGDGYRLAIEPDDVDRFRYQRLVDESRALVDTNPEAALVLIDEAHSLWRGDPWEGLGDAAWLAAEVQRVRDLCADGVDVQAQALVHVGQWDRAVTLLRYAIDVDPFRERRWELLMVALYGGGHQQGALAAFDDLRTLLVEELGVEPQPALQRLRSAILAHDESVLPTARPVTRGSVVVVPHNVPHPLTRLVGRDGDRARVLEAVGRSRLVTLTGPGGTGKTRLAIDVALSLLGSFPDGVWFVDLDRVGNRPVAAEVAASLPLRANDVGDIDALVTMLRDLRTLIVLDNCEQRVDDAAATVDRLLRSCEHLRVLATSRLALDLVGEARVAVPPLALPPDGTFDPGAPLAPASQLFVERALDHVELDLEDRRVRRAVDDIARRLDGLPLAIELAASELRVLELDRLAERLEDHVAALDVEHRERPLRQRALRASLDITHSILQPDEAAWVRRLSVLPAGFTLRLLADGSAGHDVAGDTHHRLVDRLVAASLVCPTGASPRIFRMLETTRRDALQRLLDAGEEEDARAWARSSLTALARRTRAELIGPGQRGAVAVLDALYPNVIDVLVDAERRGRVADVVDLVASLDRYWFLRPHWGDGVRWTNALLARGPEVLQPLDHARLIVASVVGRRTRDNAVAAFRDELEAALRVLAEHGRIEEHLEGAGLLALDLAVAGDFERFDRIVGDAEPLLDEASSDWYRLAADAVRAIARATRGDVAGGCAEIRRIRDAIAEHGDLAFASRLSIWAALGARLSGDDDAARVDLRHSLALSAQAGVGGMESRVLFLLAEMGDDPHDTAAQLEASLESALTRGDRTLAAQCTRDLAQLALERGDRDEARALFRSAVETLGAISPVDLGILLVQIVPLATSAAIPKLLDGASELLVHAAPIHLPQRMRLTELLTAHGMPAPEVASVSGPRTEGPDTVELAALACAVLDAP